MKKKDRKIVIINQAANYLTVGLVNEFANKFEKVALVTGSIHIQGEELDKRVAVTKIHKWKEEHGISKVLNYLRALLSMWYLLMTRYREYEVFFVSVPPMGYLLNLVLPHRFSMLIWDVFPDGLKITGMKETHPVYKTWVYLNRLSFKKAYRIFTIGEKMAESISQYVVREKLIVQPIWSIFQENEKVPKKDNSFIAQNHLENKFIVQYSGNIGLTHKVELLVKLAENMQNHKDIQFQIIGRGPRKKALQSLVSEKGLKNCQFLPFQSDEMFPYSLSAADVGVVILDSITAKGSVPSKSYNLMSYGIPALYIASPDSELNHYADIFQHAACIDETELDQAREFILKLKNDKTFYKTLSDNSIKAAQNFRRENAGKFVEKYLNA